MKVLLYNRYGRIHYVHHIGCLGHGLDISGFARNQSVKVRVLKTTTFTRWDYVRINSVLTVKYQFF